MPLLVPDWWIFLVKAACGAFSWEGARRFKSNIPRKIESDGLLCKALSYWIRLFLVEQPPRNFNNNLLGEL